MNRRIFALCIFLSLITSAVYSQSYKFKVYTYKDGLPQDYIYSITQSSKGNLFIGTGEGLAKYNSKEFSTFSKSKGIKDSFVTSSLTDQSGKIWIGHFNGGITLFDNYTFTPLKIEQITSSPINTIFQTRSGEIWAGTKSDGLLKINPDLTVEVFDELHSSSINAITEDPSGNIYLGTDEGVVILKYSHREISVYQKALSNFNVISLSITPNSKEILAGTAENGMFKSSYQTCNFKKVSTFNNLNINVIQEDQEGALYISSFGNGVFKCTYKNNTFTISRHYSQKTGLVSNYVKSLFIDRENNVWFGTYGSGLALLVDPIFTLYTKLDGLGETSTQCISLDENDKLWVASANKVSVLGDKEGLFQPVEDLEIPSTITSMISDQTDLFIGTKDSGVYKFNKQSATLRKWFFSKSKILNNKINYLCNDKKGNIWIATDEGVIKKNILSGDLDFFSMKDGLPHNKIHSIFCDSRNKIWFATRGGGLSYYQQGNIHVIESPFKGRSFEINCFAEDKLGGLWIGTYGQGVFLFQHGRFLRKYDDKSGLASSYCYFLSFDANNKLWIGHKSGLSKFDPIKEKFTYYESKDGSFLGEINNLAGSRDAQGNVWIGTENGLVCYNPGADKPISTGPIVSLTSVLLNFLEVDWTEFSDSTYEFGKVPYRAQLPHNKNHLTFNVIAVSLKPQKEKVMYQYKLEGFEKEWSLVTHEPFITYANIPPGNYILKVRAGTKSGTWTEMSTPYFFTVNSPFWQTWWFIFLSLSLGFFSVMGIVKLRTDRLREQREKLKKDKMILEAEIRQRVIAQKKQKLVEEKLKQTNEELNNFIYRSSHDLRGPISTVKGLTQLGSIEVKDPAATKFFNMILDRAQVLDGLLKSLISIVEIIEGDISIAQIDFHALAGTVLEKLKKENSFDKINLDIDFEIQSPFYNDSKLIYTVLYSLLDNSIKYKKEGVSQTAISLKIAKIKDQEHISIEIKDSGIGITEEIKPKIFEMFYRGTDVSKGSGLGLYTVKKIVDKLEGTLKLESTHNVGTFVKITLPSLTKSETTREED